MVLPDAFLRRLVVLGAVLAAGCASRAGSPLESPDKRDARLVNAAGIAQREGRRHEALALYEEITATSPARHVARDAWLAIGVLHLGGDAATFDASKGEAALRAARSLYPAGEEPPVLTALLTMLDQLREARGTAATAHLAQERALTSREEELREARRHIAQLRRDLEKRDEALKKAADAAIGVTRRR